MNTSRCLNMHFDDFSESFYLIKFGKKEHLEQIQNGVIRFSHIDKYKEIENKDIGDKDEGLESVYYKDNKTEFHFWHPNLNNGNEFDITNSILSMWNYPSSNKFISCFSYLTAKDIFESNIFSNEILKEKNWDSVLFILDTKGFVDRLMNTMHNFSPIFGKVKYLDYSKNQSELDEFCKSNKYKHQKEIRFSLQYSGIKTEKVKQIDDYTIEIISNKVQSVIIPTSEFREGFSIK